MSEDLILYIICFFWVLFLIGMILPMYKSGSKNQTQNFENITITFDKNNRSKKSDKKA
jgi:hypothetical protein